MRLLAIVLFVIFAHSSLQAASAKYGVYIYRVDQHTNVDIYLAGFDDHIGLSVAEATMFLEAIELGNGSSPMVSMVAVWDCDQTDYKPVLKAIINSKNGMYLSSFSTWGGEQMRTWVERHHKELADHTAATPF